MAAGGRELKVGGARAGRGLGAYVWGVGMFDFVLGFVLLGLAAVTGGLRAYGKHHLLGWRGSLQSTFGEKLGDGLHFAAYTVSPALLGLCFIVIASLRD